MIRSTVRPLSLATVFALILCAFAAEAAAESAALARSGRFGLGLGGSNLTSGVTGKLYLTENQAIQGTVGYWYSSRNGLSFSADYLFEAPAFVTHEALTLHWYLGAGASLGLFSWNANVGVSGVGGVALQLKPVPLEFAIELRPGVIFVGPNSGFHFGTGGAIRYFF